MFFLSKGTPRQLRLKHDGCLKGVCHEIQGWVWLTLPLKKDRFKIFWTYPRWYAMAHNKRGESKSMLSLPPPRWVWVGHGIFRGGGGNIQKIGPSVPYFFILSCLGLPPPPPHPQPMAFPMSLSDGSSRLMSHHSSCFMSHGSSCPMMTLVSCLTSHGVSCRTVHGSSWLLLGGGGDLMSRGVGMSHHGSCLTERAVKKKTTESPPNHPPTHPPAPCLPGEEKEKKKK
jgi:hypothetical protein